MQRDDKKTIFSASKYCKFRNFCDNFIFDKRHIGNVKNLQLGHDLPISIKDRVNVPFHKDLFS